MDFFAGSGTTGAVARRLGRRFALVDVNREAITIMRKRLGRVDVRYVDDLGQLWEPPVPDGAPTVHSSEDADLCRSSRSQRLRRASLVHIVKGPKSSDSFGISHGGRSAEDLFISLTGAQRVDKAALGDAVLEGRHVEVKHASSSTLNQVRAVKYIPLVVYHSPSTAWYVVPASHRRTRCKSEIPRPTHRKSV